MGRALAPHARTARTARTAQAGVSWSYNAAHVDIDQHQHYQYNPAHVEIDPPGQDRSTSEAALAHTLIIVVVSVVESSS